MDMNQLIENFLQYCRDGWAWLCNETVDYAKATERADFECDFGVAFFLAVLVLFFLGSACWAASIAACRRHNAVVHFIIGLLLPWIYPLVILFAMDIKGTRAMRRKIEQQRVEAEAAEAERQKNIELNSGKSELKEDDGALWTQKKMDGMARRPDGTPAGPWNVTYAGRFVKVLHIVEALPEVVSVEFEDDNGSTLKMRIPYAKIESWENA